jgi:hypothetical protein
LLLVAAPVLATQIATEPPLRELLAQASVVVHATVEAADTAWVEDEWGRHIWTTYRFRTHRSLKGNSPGGEVMLRLIGGTVADRTEVVFDVPRPTLGQEGIFFFTGSATSPALALVETLPVSNGEVAIGSGRVRLAELSNAISELLRGDRAELDRLQARGVLSLCPTDPHLRSCYACNAHGHHLQRLVERQRRPRR